MGDFMSEQKTAFEAWYRHHHGDRDVYVLDESGEYADKQVRGAFNAWQAAIASQDREEIIEMALCESRQLVLRIGQAYRFTPRDGCKTCEEMKNEHDQAYSIEHARRIEDKP